MSDQSPIAAGPTAPAEPEGAPPAAAVPRAPLPTLAARWIDLASGALLLATALVTITAAVPSLLHIAGLPLQRASSRERLPTIDVRHQPPEILSDPDKLLDSDRDIEPDDAPFEPTRGHAQLGHARGAVALRDRPADQGRPLGAIQAGELVMILKESGDWLQVWASGADGVVMGWVKKSGIAVR